MSKLPPTPPPPFDPELEAAIRRNVATYWSPEGAYEERLQAQAALQGLAVEGFRELLYIVDMLRSTLRNPRTGWPEPDLIKKSRLPLAQAPFPEGFWDGLGKGKGSS